MKCQNKPKVNLRGIRNNNINLPEMKMRNKFQEFINNLEIMIANLKKTPISQIYPKTTFISEASPISPITKPASP